MEKELNLVKLLKDAPKGTKLYSPIFGECEFKCIVRGLIYVTVKESCDKIFFEDGTYYDGGECLLFPSKENRDWSTFKVEKEGFKVGDYVKEKDSSNVFKIKSLNIVFVTLIKIIADSPEIERTTRVEILDRYEKVSKFDLKWLKPFDRVLMRNGTDSRWVATFFSHTREEDGVRLIIAADGYNYSDCIPYNEETKHLVGTADDEPKFYKID